MLHTIINAAAPLTSVSSMKTKAEREQLLTDITTVLQPFDVKIEITPYSNRHFVAVIRNDHLAAMVDFDGNDPDPSMIHWCHARAPLKAVPFAWAENDINPCHRRKATSFPQSFVDLVKTLAAGFAAAADGSAFRLGKSAMVGNGTIEVLEKHLAIRGGTGVVASITDVFSYFLSRARTKLTSQRLLGLAYLADWKSCLERGRQITSVTWAFLGGPTPFETPKLPHEHWNLTSSGAMLGEDWPSLTKDDIAILNRVINETSDLFPGQFTKVIHSTHPALTSERATPLNLVAFARRHQDQQAN